MSACPMNGAASIPVEICGRIGDVDAAMSAPMPGSGGRLHRLGDTSPLSTFHGSSAVIQISASNLRRFREHERHFVRCDVRLHDNADGFECPKLRGSPSLEKSGRTRTGAESQFANPCMSLPFTQVKPGMQVLDVSAGGGDTSQLPALAVGLVAKARVETPQARSDACEARCPSSTSESGRRRASLRGPRHPRSRPGGWT